MKRLGVLIIFLLTTVQLLAQTQYDYYEGRDAYGGVDTAISGLKILGIIILAILAIVIVGIIWAKTMDLFKTSPKMSQRDTDKLQGSSKNMEDVVGQVEPIKDVVITISGIIVNADVTMEDGTKKMEFFWYEIGTVTYNLGQDITHCIGDEIVKPAGSVYKGLYVKKEDVNRESMSRFKCDNHLRVRGKFTPQKLRFIRIEGLGIYDRWVYYYDGEAQMQGIISEKEAKEMAGVL